MNLERNTGSTEEHSLATPPLSPVDRTQGVLFGLIMALTFTGSLSVATADQEEVRSMLIGALGCNVAWGLVDAVMYLLASAADKGRELVLLKELRATSDPQTARELIADALPPVLSSVVEPAELDALRSRLATRTLPTRRILLSLADLRGAVVVFLLVFLATLPIALPFAFIPQAHLALRVSNGIALVMLFLGGWQLGRYSGRSPIQIGLVTLAIGVLLVWATIALGG
jgi:VIT1/CCC1 family predicted Fe2+/Mn2+ transporter